MQDVNVKLNVFEGPMELLYHLIEKNKIDIYDIPISELADQYIDYIKMFPADMESMSSFIVMGTSLLEIKSKTLLPVLQAEEEEDDPREALVKKLLEYKRFKEISEVLKQRHEDNKTILFKTPEDNILNMFANKNVDTDEVLNGITMDVLFNVFNDILKRKDLKTDKIRSGFNSVKKDIYTVEEKIDYIREMLLLRKKFVFEDIFDETSEKIEIVTIFLAILELIKVKEIKIEQKNIFDKIYISEYKESVSENA